MASVTIKLSEAALTARDNAALAAGEAAGTVNGALDAALTLVNLVNDNYYYYSSVKASTSKVVYRFADGASSTLTGSLDMPYLGYGYGTINQTSFLLPGRFSLESAGSTRAYFYSDGGYYTQNGAVNSLKLSVLDGSVSPLGKSTATLRGTIQFDSGKNLSGTVTSLSSTASKLIKASDIVGSFTIQSGNMYSPSGYYSDGFLKKYVNVSGSLTKFNEKYYDGSLIAADFSSAPITISNGESIDLNQLTNPENFQGDDLLDIALPSTFAREFTVQAGTGNDSIKLAGGGSHLHADAGDGNDSVLLIDGNHRVFGGAGNDTLTSGKGNDTLLGGAGNDVYFINGAGDQAIETTAVGGAVDAGGIDIVVSSVSFTAGSFIEHLTLSGKLAINGTGNGLANLITGNEAANRLSGEGGNDTLDGGAGKDTLTGGAGSDRFVFSTKLGAANADTITDFEAGHDKIVLDTRIFAKLGNATDFLTVGIASDAAGRFLVYNSTTGQLSYDADGSGTKSKPVDIAFIGAGLALTVNDFLIV